MKVEIGKNGVIYCNTVKYNWKQARNFIADGCSGNMSGCWNFNGDSNYTSDVPGYKSFRSFYIKPNGEDMMTQSLPTMDFSHKYYLSFRFKSNALSNMAIRIKNASTVFFQYYIGENSVGQWVHKSMIVSGSAGEQSELLFCVAAYDTEIWLSRFIMVDLTDTFGAGNEPTQQWCDKNIREHEVFINFGCVSNNVTKENLKSRYYASNIDSYGPFNYLEVPGNWEPREYMYMLKGKMDMEEGYVYSESTFALDNTDTYYAYIEYHRPYAYANDMKESIQFFFPEAEPPLGEILIVNNTAFNGGGGMREWKRAGFFNNRNTFSNGNYKLRIDYNNLKRINELRLTAINLQKVSSNVSQYNSYNNTNISETDVNKEWCDRWIDGRSSPIVHIKDPNNTKINISIFGEIICNDIEIRPELNKVEFDYSTGTIFCKKLIKTQSY